MEGILGEKKLENKAGLPVPGVPGKKRRKYRLSQWGRGEKNSEAINTISFGLERPTFHVGKERNRLGKNRVA